MNINFSVPSREQMPEENQHLYDRVFKAYGMVPNMFPVLSYSQTALGALLTLQQSHTKGSFSAKEREAINLIVSQTNNCMYCISAHSAIGKMVGFSEEQLVEIRKGKASFDLKLETVVKLAASITSNKGYPEKDLLYAFYGAGYTSASLIDMVMLIGDRVIINYLYAMAQVPIDFPLAEEI